MFCFKFKIIRVIQILKAWKKLCSHGTEVSTVNFWLVKPRSYVITDVSE
jgi:hypothetical protein